MYGNITLALHAVAAIIGLVLLFSGLKAKRREKIYLGLGILSIFLAAPLSSYLLLYFGAELIKLIGVFMYSGLFFQALGVVMLCYSSKRY